MALYSLDTNILSYLLRKNQGVIDRLDEAVSAGHDFILCPVVYYELRRGLLKKDALVQLATLDVIVADLQWMDVDREVWVEASYEWARARKAGRSPADSDLLIACHASRYSATVVTNNPRDFRHFPVKVENWV